MPNDIKSLLDDIINNTNNSFSNEKSNSGNDIKHAPINFDANKYREKISLDVLKDLVCAMMHNETKDVDHMIDQSITNHIKSNYNGTCYGYLCNARDRLMSPLIDEIIQEIDNKTNDMSNKLSETKDIDALNEKVSVKDLLKDTTNYDEFIKKITEKTTNDVINDVADVISKSTNAPVFDNIDDEMSKIDEETTNESVILRICGSIVTESYVNKEPISTKEGLNRAIMEYCIYKMDYLFKAEPKESIMTKYSK